MHHSMDTGTQEVNGILTPEFKLWALLNNFDYRTNTSYDPNNPFTWNYHGVQDVFGNILPGGNWRAIYRWYYGTDAPNIRPWEMLGFTYQPTWWVPTYGLPPYLSTNTLLWTDMQNGTIAGGPRMGADPDYARPGLLNIIPVDGTGNLLNPIQVGIVNINLPASVASRPWVAGDQGPAENLWINSPSYRFSLAQAAFLMKPARFMEECWDSLHIGYVGPQWVEFATLYRPLNDLQYVHGETTPAGIVAVVIGVQQWISDYIVSANLQPSDFGTAVRNLNVQLIHQMAGFVSSDEIQALADNFGLLPSEDVQVILYTSPTVDTETYSGVILTWTGSSWRAVGYDARNPYFTIFPPDTNSARGTISIATTAEPKIVQWSPNTYYQTGIYALYLGTVYQCTTSHTSGPIFENLYWTVTQISPNPQQAPRVTTYSRTLNATQLIPYGTEFYTYQDVANFLLGWQSWLVSRGWAFIGVDTSTGEILDWAHAVKDFLNWSQIQWQPGNFIALSPGQLSVQFVAAVGTILNVEDNTTGFFGLLDRSGNPIRQQDAVINRLDGQITIAANNADVFCVRLQIVNIEHALVFSNVTIFDDDVYLPLFDMRQIRLRLLCNRAMDWAGRLDAPGYVIIGNLIKSDFEKSANDVRLMFDIEKADVVNLRNYARHNIAFQQRTYLNNLLINEVEQFEFYQGMIQQKGTPDVFEKLMRSIVASSNNNLQFLQEWAFLLDDFGAPVDPLVTFLLSQTDDRDDPQIVRFVSMSNAPLDWIIMPLTDPRWYDKPDSADFFTIQTEYVTPKLPTAGPVRPSDVTNTVFSISDIPTEYQTLFLNGIMPFATDTRTWVYQRADGTFTVLESFETGTVPNSILTVQTHTENVAVSTAVSRIIFQNLINMTTADVGDYLVIDGSSLSNPDLQGAQIIATVDADTFIFPTSGSTSSGATVVNFTSTTGLVVGQVVFGLNIAPGTIISSFIVNVSVTLSIATTGIIPDSTNITFAPNYVEVSVAGTAGYDFTSDLSSGPFVRILREVRFAILSDLTSSGYVWQVNDIAWIDDYSGGLWAVVQWNGSAWVVIRNQPLRTDPTTVSETVIYYENVVITNQQMIINEPVVPVLDVIDPLAGLMTGISAQEIDYQTSFDPAGYNSGAANPAVNPWGVKQVGRVWYNLATTIFLDPFTDILGASAARDLAELTNRIGSWCQIAPGASVDVYEWVVSTEAPLAYSADTTQPGTVYNATNPSWVEEAVFDQSTGTTTINYYFWVSGLSTIPDVSFRHTDISTVALGIQNPTGLDIPWMAPISADSLIYSGVKQFLNDTDTVLKVRLTLDPENAGRHDEWLLMRPTDETSLPTDQMWFQVRNSLGTFDENLNPLPAPYLAPTRNTGIMGNQNLFEIGSNRMGLMHARRMFVQSINNIFAATPIAIDRQTYIPTIIRSTIINPNLVWTQIDLSYPYESAPGNEWDYEVFTLAQRNDLLGREDFLAAVYSGTVIRVLINSVANPPGMQGWSIWHFNPATAALVILHNPFLPPGIAMLENADTVFDLALSYEYSVGTDAERVALVNPIITIAIGSRVYVQSDVQDFWAIWKYVGVGQVGADAYGFIIWRVQTYRTSDFFAYVNWYAAGYSANNPPIVTYANATARNAIEGSNPTNLFVALLDDGTPNHYWEWTAFQNGEWVTVANQNGTIALSSTFYSPNTVVHGLPTPFTITAPVESGNVIPLSSVTGITVGQPFTGQTQQPPIIGINVQIGTHIAAVNGNTVTLTQDITGPLEEGDMVYIVTPMVNDIANRDGSWEIFILAHALRYTGILLDSEINQNWFDIVNFCHVQQADIDWAFKTSFMDIIGYNVTLAETPYEVPDQTQNLEDYVNEVKPYRVKIREISTQYDTPIDMGNMTVTDFDNPSSYWSDNYLTNPSLIRGLDITIAFDRYAANIETWDSAPWDSEPWDDSENLESNIYVHTTVNQTLSAPSRTIFVNDITGLTGRTPFTINLNGYSYMIGLVTIDNVNVSTSVHGFSGSLTTMSGNITVVDGTSGNVVEAILPMLSAAQRIINYYTPSATMAPNDLVLLLGLDYQPSSLIYSLTADVPIGGSVLTFASLAGVSEGYQISGPNIILGTDRNSDYWRNDHIEPANGWSHSCWNKHHI